MPEFSLLSHYKLCQSQPRTQLWRKAKARERRERSTFSAAPDKAACPASPPCGAGRLKAQMPS